MIIGISFGGGTATRGTSVIPGRRPIFNTLKFQVTLQCDLREPDACPGMPAQQGEPLKPRPWPSCS
ncbi:hypothetical protein I5U23_10945 [Stenotrophomonas maltophilia]|uniref:Uncharacterized protein n=1 Tax=Stenotrophomonas riyadhensis TaxID=2859893 RepID=A0ABT2XAA0_9GAMM|nr:hypothetical protein [Stenotrophomonas sp. CFS3442]MBH1618425.1 hypothetical protein [Stenotrophomonas maltophilia]MCV0322862.1 hypothetical protein [Stenotrophomonas sp. CFS3442]HEL4243656.1 hypothetical protein [Stenotrophomonas maltophilia]